MKEQKYGESTLFAKYQSEFGPIYKLRLLGRDYIESSYRFSYWIPGTFNRRYYKIFNFIPPQLIVIGIALEPTAAIKNKNKNNNKNMLQLV